MPKEDKDWECTKCNQRKNFDLFRLFPILETAQTKPWKNNVHVPSVFVNEKVTLLRAPFFHDRVVAHGPKNDYSHISLKDKCFILSRIAMFLQEPSRCCSDRLISFGKHC